MWEMQSCKRTWERGGERPSGESGRVMIYVVVDEVMKYVPGYKPATAIWGIS